MLEYVGLAGLLIWSMWNLSRRLLSRPAQFPVVGSPNDAHFADAILNGHRKYPDMPFLIPTVPPRIILPMNLFREAMRAPSTHLSFMQSIYDMFQGRYTYIGREIGDLIHIIKLDLNRNIIDVLPLLQDEADHFLLREVGTSGEWKTMPIHQFMVRMVASLNSRVFIGLPLARDEKWIETTINYAAHVGAVQQAAQKYGPIVRPFIVPFLPEVRAITCDLEEARKFLTPLVNEAVEIQTNGSAQANAESARFISSILKYHGDSKTAVERAGMNQMVLSFVALHTTSMTSAFVLLDLARHPEYIKPLRDEITETLREKDWKVDAHGRRYLEKSTFQKLSLLDSFIKESQRIHPLNLVEGWRVATKEFSFSNGLKIPKGSSLAWPLWGVYNSPSTPILDPLYNKEAGNPGPEVFDGFRFAKLQRRYSPDGQKFSAASTSEYSLNFGHGPHSCPGRFFAIHEIKTILVNILINYDLRMKSVAEADYILRGIHTIPGPIASIEFRWRQDIDK